MVVPCVAEGEVGGLEILIFVVVVVVVVVVVAVVPSAQLSLPLFSCTALDPVPLVYDCRSFDPRLPCCLATAWRTLRGGLKAHKDSARGDDGALGDSGQRA